MDSSLESQVELTELHDYKMPVVSDNLLKYTLTGCGVFVCWALWYDHHRRSKPDYLEKLMNKKKKALIEKHKREDPKYYANTVELIDTADPMAVQQQIMAVMMEGEALMGKDSIDSKRQGAAKIATGLANYPQQMLGSILPQLQSQFSPADFEIVIEALRTVKVRIQAKQMEKIFGVQKQTTAKTIKPATKTIEPVKEEAKKSEDGPVDVDSIDGDDDDRIQEIKEDTKEEQHKIEPIEAKIESAINDKVEAGEPVDVDSIDDDEKKNEEEEDESKEDVMVVEQLPEESEPRIVEIEEEPVAEPKIQEKETIPEEVTLTTSEHEILQPLPTEEDQKPVDSTNVQPEDTNTEEPEKEDDNISETPTEDLLSPQAIQKETITQEEKIGDEPYHIIDEMNEMIEKSAGDADAEQK